MATKRLSRTPLEAGNTPWYQRVRRDQRRAHRHEAKVFCRRILHDADAYDETPEPVAPEHRDRRGLWNEEMHADRSGAVARWITAQAGRPWDAVYSEIRRTFDRRTLAGWHIVDNHLPRPKDFREGDGMAWCRNGRLFVDDAGILRFLAHLPPARRRLARRMAQAPSRAELTAWLAGRRVRFRDGIAFWLVRSDPRRTKAIVEVAVESPYVSLRDRKRIALERGIPWWKLPVLERVRVVRRYARYRQDRRLTPDEFAFYARLTKDQRKIAQTPAEVTVR